MEKSLKIWINSDKTVQKINNVFLFDNAYAIAYQYIITHDPHQIKQKYLAQDLIDLIAILRLKYGIRTIDDFKKFNFEHTILKNYGIPQSTIDILTRYAIITENNESILLAIEEPSNKILSKGVELYGDIYNTNDYVTEANQELINILTNIVEKNPDIFEKKLSALLQQQSSLLFNISNVSENKEKNDLDIVIWYQQFCTILSKKLTDNPKDEYLTALKPLATLLAMVALTVRSKESALLKQAMIELTQIAQNQYHKKNLFRSIFGQTNITHEFTSILSFNISTVNKNDSPNTITSKSRGFKENLYNIASPQPSIGVKSSQILSRLVPDQQDESLLHSPKTNLVNDDFFLIGEIFSPSKFKSVEYSLPSRR